jgi:biotin transport system substrate-specific component
MTLTLAAGRPTLADRIFSRRLATDFVLVAAGAAFVSLAAQLTIPLPLVPITGQTLAVLIVGASLGATRGAVSLSLYALLGLVGLPVFSPKDDGSHVVGTAAFLGSTGGFIIGFIAAAALTGWLAQRQWDRKIVKAIVSFSAGTIVTFIFGNLWLGYWMGANGFDNDLNSVLSAGLYPFIIGGVVKALLAAGFIRLAWFGVDRTAAKPATDED